MASGDVDLMVCGSPPPPPSPPPHRQKQGGAAGLGDDGDSDDSAGASGDESLDAGAVEDDDEDEFGAGGSNGNRSGRGGGGGGGGKSPLTRAVPGRRSGRLSGGASSPLPEPAVVDHELKAATCHRQVGLVLQKGNTLRAGLRFAFRVARTPEDIQAMAKERAETGVEWAKYEVPGDDLELDLEAYPGLVLPPPPPPLEEQGQKVGAGGGGGGGDGGVLLPGISGPAAGAEEGAQTEMSGDGGGDAADDDADADVSNLYVALQGFMAHDVNDPEVRLRPRGTGSDALVAAAASSEGGAAAAAAATDEVPAVAASTSDSTNLAAAAVAAADAAAAVEKIQSVAAPLPVLEDEVTESLKRTQTCLKIQTKKNLETIDAKKEMIKQKVIEAARLK